MSFLPIVERELRVAARRGVTYWSRVIAAGVVTLIASGVFLIMAMEPGAFANQLGPILFAIFKWLSFIAVSTAGVLLTADCLSEEKREGTLGLLFLTDLRGYDVVFGKLLATSLRAAYGLLAAFPVMAIGFLVGGVTGGEFWRLMLVLCNTLFFSLAAGMFISSVSREPQKAMAGAVLLGLLFFVVLPLIDSWIGNLSRTGTDAWCSLFSPVLAFSETDAKSLRNFWISTALTHALGWGFLGLASFYAPRNWHEKAVTPNAGSNSRAQRRHFGSPVKRAALRRRLLGLNPAAWLAARDHWLARFVLLLVLACAVVVVISWVGSTGQTAFAGVSSMLLWVINVVFQLCLISQASRFFVEAARNGALELLLVSPLTVAQIVRGQAWALRRMFLWPAIGLLVLTAAGDVQQIAQFYKAYKTTSGGGFDMLAYQIIQQAMGLLSFCSGLFALAWFGMWMGLTTTRANVAVIKTLVFVQVLPWLVFTFLQIFLMVGWSSLAMKSGMPNMSMFWVPNVIAGTLAIGVDVGFAVVSRRKVLTFFRDYAAGGAGSGVVFKPAPRRAADPSAPPVLAP